MSHELIQAEIEKQYEMRDTYLSLISFDLRTLNFSLYQKLQLVTVNLGRRMGHTTFIEKYASYNDLVILDGIQNTRQFSRNVNNNPKVLTYNSNFNNQCRGQKFDFNNIWIDDFSKYDGIDWNIIKDNIRLFMLPNMNPPQIIRLG